MSMILDLVVVIVAVLCAYLGWRGGFAKAVIGFFGFFIALIGGYFLAPLLGKVLLPGIQSFFDSKAEDSFLGIVGGFDLTATVVANVLAFGILFIALNILIFVVKLIAKGIFKLPVLKQADKLLGLLLGIVKGYFLVSVVSLIMFTFSEFLIRVFDGLTPEMFTSSVIASWFYEHNIFKFIMELGSKL